MDVVMEPAPGSDVGPIVRVKPVTVGMVVSPVSWTHADSRFETIQMANVGEVEVGHVIQERRVGGIGWFVTLGGDHEDGGTAQSIDEAKEQVEHRVKQFLEALGVQSKKAEKRRLDELAVESGLQPERPGLYVVGNVLTSEGFKAILTALDLPRDSVLGADLTDGLVFDCSGPIPVIDGVAKALLFTFGYGPRAERFQKLISMYGSELVRWVDTAHESSSPEIG